MLSARTQILNALGSASAADDIRLTSPVIAPLGAITVAFAHAQTNPANFFGDAPASAA